MTTTPLWLQYFTTKGLSVIQAFGWFYFYTIELCLPSWCSTGGPKVGFSEVLSVTTPFLRGDRGIPHMRTFFIITSGYFQINFVYPISQSATYI